MATAKKSGAVKEAPKTTKKSAGTALSTKNAARLKAIGIDVSTEEDAREKLMKIFKANGLDDMGNDPLVELIEMAEAFPESEVEDTEAEDADVVEEEEAPAPKTKKAGKKVKEVEPEPEEEEEVEEISEEDAEEEVDEPDTEEEEEEEVEEEAPAPKVKGKKAGKGKAAKTVVEEADEDADALVEEVEEKELEVPKKRKAPPASDGKKAKKSTRVRKLQGKHWEDLTKEEKEKAVKPLKKVLPEKEFRFEFLARSFVVKYLGKTNEHNIFKYHLIRLLDNGKMEAIFVSHRFKTPEEFQEYLPENLSGFKLNQGESCSYIHPFTQDQMMELLTDTDFLKESIARATKQDTKMKANREKLEAQLNGTKDEKKTTSKPVAKAGKAAKVEEEIEEEEEEEVEEVPVKAKKVVAKVVVAPKKEAPVPAKKVVAKKEEPVKEVPKKKK